MTVKLYGHGKDKCVKTDSTTEAEFVADFAAALTCAMREMRLPDDADEGRLPYKHFGCDGWIAAAFEIVAKLKGYKSQVSEKRLLWAGVAHPSEEEFVAYAGPIESETTINEYA